MSKKQYIIVYAVGYYAGSVSTHWYMLLVGIGAFIAFDVIINFFVSPKKSIQHL